MDHDSIAIVHVQPITSLHLSYDEQKRCFLNLDITVHFGISATCGRRQEGNRWYMTSLEVMVVRFDDNIRHVSHEPTDEEKTLAIQYTKGHQVNLQGTIGWTGAPNATLTPSWASSQNITYNTELKYFKTTYEYWEGDSTPEYRNSQGETSQFPSYEGMNRWVVELSHFQKEKFHLPSRDVFTDDFQKKKWHQIPEEALGSKCKVFRLSYAIDDAMPKKTRLAILIRNNGRKTRECKAYQFCLWQEFVVNWENHKIENFDSWTWSKDGFGVHGERYM